MYGEPIWADQFGKAELSEGWRTPVTWITCPADPFHRTSKKLPHMLSIVLPSPRIGHFVWMWVKGFLVTDSVLHLFQEAGFTGFEPHPVKVERVKHVRKGIEVQIPALWELRIIGKGGDAHPDSGIYVYESCEVCEYKRYSSFKNGFIVDEANWDGSDFFTVNGYPYHILVTERVKESIIANRLVNCALIPSHQIKWRSEGDTPEEWAEKCRVRANRSLSSLLRDLNSSDDDKVYEAVCALGDKGDPGGIDALLKMFSYQAQTPRKSTSIRRMAADSVAKTVRPTIATSEVREETFAKLCRLLRDPHPWVRKCAIQAISYTVHKLAGKEIMSLLRDPDGSVRSAAVDALGIMDYKPAAQAIRKLLKDRNKYVREEALNALPGLETERIT